jgi:ligand-binding sensor domain-containing protein/signal transduction histidine kinase
MPAGLGAAAAPEWLVASWHMDDGLPDDSVTAIQQTPDGYLWVGTPKGLARFDGARFEVFDARYPPALKHAGIASLLVDRAGTLWIGSESGSLVRYEHGQFRTVNSPLQARRLAASGSLQGRDAASEDAIRWLWRRSDNLIEDGEGAVFWALAGSGLARFKDGQWTTFTATNGIPAGEVGDLTCDSEGRVWFAAGGRRYRFEDGKWLPAAGAELDGPLPVLSPARPGGMWVAAPRGSWVTGGAFVRRFDDGTWLGFLEPTPGAPHSLRSQATALLEDHSGRLWLGTLRGGVYYSDAGGQWQRLRNEHSLAPHVITCLFEDSQGSVWVGTVGEGLHRVRRQLVTVSTLPPPADENIITTTCATRDGSVWVGTDGAGAFRYQNGTFASFGAAEGLSSQHVCSICEDRQANLWCGTWDGLFKFGEGRWARVDGPPELGFAVLALFGDRAGRLWIGTPRGLVCRQSKGFSVHRLGQTESYFDIRSIAEDAAGDLWVGTIDEGLFRLRANQVERFGPAQGFASANARSLYCDSAGVLWVGSDGDGLFRFSDNRFTAYAGADGLPNGNIRSIIEDGEGNLWMGSDNGIFGCARRLLNGYEPGRSPALLCRRLSIAEGLDGRTYSGGGQPVVTRSADGRLWFPSKRGLAVFDPRAIAAERPASEVRVESALVDGTEWTATEGKQLRVPSSARRVEFRYTAPDLAFAQSLRFRYKLEGIDPDWVDAGGQRVAGYSQLLPGRYQFRVMVGRADGQWHEGWAALALQVVPRWWEVRWIEVLAGVVLMGAVAGGVAFSERRKLHRRLKRLEMQHALEDERRRIAQDLHDDVGAQLTEIVLVGELAKRGEQTVGGLQAQVSAITQKVRQLVTAMEEVVWTVNPKNDSLPNLAAYLGDYTERFLARATPTMCRLDVAENLPPLPIAPQVRHHLLLAVKEALNNAARHASASKVWLRIHLEGPHLNVAVADDGRGFDPARPSRSGNGLQNMRSRMEAVGGSVVIESETGQGTTVTLLLPVVMPDPGLHALRLTPLK